MNRTTCTRAAAALLALLPLAGCSAGYIADVRNSTPQPLGARLIRADRSGQDALLAEDRLGPGDRKAVGRYRVPAAWSVYLEVDTQGHTGAPARLDLTPGTTKVNVVQEGPSQTGPLRIEVVSRR